MSDGAPANAAQAAGLGGAEEGRVGPPKTPQQIAAQRRLQQTQAQVDEVVGIMRMNVEKVIERDQKLSELDDRADALQQGASQFEQQAGKLKRKFWLKNLKMMIIMGVIGLIVIIIIGVSIFGGGESSGSSPAVAPTPAPSAPITPTTAAPASDAGSGIDYFASTWLFEHENSENLFPFASSSSRNISNSTTTSYTSESSKTKGPETYHNLTSTTLPTSTAGADDNHSVSTVAAARLSPLLSRMMIRGHDVLDPAMEMNRISVQNYVALNRREDEYQDEAVPLLKSASNATVSILGPSVFS